MVRCPTTILQVLPKLETGGVERGTIEITQAIRDGGGRPLVASAGGRLVPAVARAGGRHIGLPLETKDPLNILLNARRLRRMIRQEGVAVVHARSRAPGWSAYLAARQAGVPFVTTYHGAYADSGWGKRLYNSVMARGDRVIATSQYVAGLIATQHRVPRDRIRIIPRGVDPAVFDPNRVSPGRLAKLAQVWRLPDGRPTILLPARLTRWKGGPVLLDAMARMARTDAVCVLVGSDQGRARFSEQLVRQADRLGLSDRLRLVGQCDDMPAALMLADVVVSASTAPEAFGRAVIEAQAMRRMVIATDHGGAAETVVDGMTGWRVPPGDPDALAAAIDHALGLSQEWRDWIGAESRASVIEHYSLAAMQAATLRVYDELAGSNLAGTACAKMPEVCDGFTGAEISGVGVSGAEVSGVEVSGAEIRPRVVGAAQG